MGVLLGRCFRGCAECRKILVQVRPRGRPISTRFINASKHHGRAHQVAPTTPSAARAPYTCMPRPESMTTSSFVAQRKRASSPLTLSRLPVACDGMSN
eukprot:scaffold25754_cov104-Isochrysis_galbana.AAC.7